METIKTIITSPAGMSIFTGIITFVITWPINNWLTNKTNKKEYFTRVDKINKQIIAVCIDYLTLARNVDDIVLERIIKGLCVEGKVNQDDAYSLQSVKAILVKEFINIRLIPDDLKKEIIEKLCTVPQKVTTENVIVEKIVHYENNKKKIELVTTLFTLVITFATVFLTLLISIYQFDDPWHSASTGGFKKYAWVVMLFMLIVCLELVLVIFMKIKRKKRDWEIEYNITKCEEDEKKEN